MKLYKSAEDYLEKILILKKEINNLRTIDIANSMKLTKQSVHRAIKNFKENGLITVDANNYINLTNKGREIAQNVYNRHIVLTNFFIKLGVDKEIAHEDACKIEHDISDESLNAIKNFLK
ncbi:MAG: metal-dependent transcriptional regulator [Bacilli bacterium]|nr:metal-dependent transcriptional regulator [Bacilli bacterium]